MDVVTSIDFGLAFNNELYLMLKLLIQKLTLKVSTIHVAVNIIGA